MSTHLSFPRLYSVELHIRVAVSANGSLRGKVLVQGLGFYSSRLHVRRNISRAWGFDGLRTHNYQLSLLANVLSKAQSIALNVRTLTEHVAQISKGLITFIKAFENMDETCLRRSAWGSMLLKAHYIQDLHCTTGSFSL